MGITFVSRSWEVLEVHALILSRVILEFATWLLERTMVIAVVMLNRWWHGGVGLGRRD